MKKVRDYVFKQYMEKIVADKESYDKMDEIAETIEIDGTSNIITEKEYDQIYTKFGEYIRTKHAIHPVMAKELAEEFFNAHY